MKNFICAAIVVSAFACTACDNKKADDPNKCVEAHVAIQDACCPVGGDHPGFTGLDHDFITYDDCQGGEATIACVVTDGLPVDQTVEGDETQETLSQACEDAIAAAEKACPGFDPTDESAIECADALNAEVLPSCEEVQALVDMDDRCNPFDLRGWDPFSIEDIDAVRYKFRTDSEEVTMSDPPPASEHDDGEVVPDPAPTLIDSNQLLQSLRLEIPGNFIRYQLANGPIQYALGEAESIDGVKCNRDTFRCEINPLELMALTDVLPDNSKLKMDIAKIQVDGETALKIENIGYNYNKGKISLSVAWDGAVIVKSKPIIIDLKKDTRFSLFPTHMPNDYLGMDEKNSYPLTDIKFPDRQKSMIDQALILTNLTRAQCLALNRSPSYQTFELPLKCVCPGENAEPTERGYCVTEFYPRDVTDVDVVNYAIDTEHAYLALCTDPLLVKVLPYKTLYELAEQGQDPDLTNDRITATFIQQFQTNAPGKITLPLDAAMQEVIKFGCSGRVSKYARVGQQITENFGSLTGTIGQGTTSAAGMELVTKVDMGGVIVELIPGEVSFDWPFWVLTEQWVQKRFKKIASWFLKWVLNLLGGFIDINIGADLPPPGWPNTATLNLGSLDLKVHGVISQVGNEGVDGFAIGTRRLHTTIPNINRDDWKLDVGWDAPNCKNIFAKNATLLERFKAFMSCPFDLIEGVAAIVLGPFTIFLSEFLLEFVGDLTNRLNTVVMDNVVSETQKMEKGNIIAQLLQSAAIQHLLEPYYLQPMGDPVKAAVGELPLGLSLACGAAPNPSIACALAHLMVGNGMVELNANTQILRVGAKTHYRSMGAFAGESPSYCFPPVRYCVVGDNPPGAPVFNESNRAASQDFHEVHVVEQGGLDWRHQCALFVDFSAIARGYIVTPSLTYEIGIWPSKRTQMLINEVFVCRNSAYCHPYSVPNFLAQRAELAACSIMGDIWGHEMGSNEPYLNQLMLLTTVTDPAGLAALQGVWDKFLENTGFGDEFNTFEELRSFANSCRTKIEDAGYALPPMTRPADTFDVGPVYECSPTWNP